MLKIHEPHRRPHQEPSLPKETPSPQKTPIQESTTPQPTKDNFLTKLVRNVVDGLLNDSPPAYLCTHDDLRRTVSETHPTVKSVIDIGCDWLEKFRRLASSSSTNGTQGQ